MIAEREIVLVLGKTGQGKSTWTKRYTSDCARLALFDPKRDYPDVEWVPDVRACYAARGVPASFRWGVYYPEEAELIASYGMVAGACTVVLEECTLCIEPGSRPDWLRDIIYLGRERDVSVIAVSQRPASIPIDIRSQATRIITFLQTEEDDIRWLKKLFGVDCLSLDRLEYLEWKQGQGVTRHRIIFLDRGKRLCQDTPPDEVVVAK